MKWYKELERCGSPFSSGAPMVQKETEVQSVAQEVLPFEDSDKEFIRIPKGFEKEYVSLPFDKAEDAS